MSDEEDYAKIRAASMKQHTDELREQRAKEAAYIEMLQTLKEPEPKHTKLHYDWFKYNLYNLGHLKPDDPMWSEDKIIAEYWTYFPKEQPAKSQRIEGGRMRYKTNHRRGKTNRRRVKTHRRRHRKH